MKFGFKKLRRKQTIPVEVILKVLWNLGEQMTVSSICQEIKRYYGTSYHMEEIQKTLQEACSIGVVIAQSKAEEMYYYPAMSEKDYNEAKLREYETLFSCHPEKSYTMPMSSRKLTEEEYERLKKLIDELD